MKLTITPVNTFSPDHVSNFLLDGNIQKSEDEGFNTYTDRVNKEYERFRLIMLTPDSFKILIFARGLTDKRDVEMRMKILSKLKINQDLTLQ